MIGMDTSTSFGEDSSLEYTNHLSKSLDFSDNELSGNNDTVLEECCENVAWELTNEMIMYKNLKKSYREQEDEYERSKIRAKDIDEKLRVLDCKIQDLRARKESLLKSFNTVLGRRDIYDELYNLCLLDNTEEEQSEYADVDTEVKLMLPEAADHMEKTKRNMDAEIGSHAHENRMQKRKALGFLSDIRGFMSLLEANIGNGSSKLDDVRSFDCPTLNEVDTASYDVESVINQSLECFVPREHRLEDLDQQMLDLEKNIELCDQETKKHASTIHPCFNQQQEEIQKLSVLNFDCLRSQENRNALNNDVARKNVTLGEIENAEKELESKLYKLNLEQGKLYTEIQEHILETISPEIQSKWSEKKSRKRWYHKLFACFGRSSAV